MVLTASRAPGTGSRSTTGLIGPAVEPTTVVLLPFSMTVDCAGTGPAMSSAAPRTVVQAGKKLRVMESSISEVRDSLHARRIPRANGGSMVQFLDLRIGS